MVPDMRHDLRQGNAASLPWADGVAQACCTSPPYYGLRDYPGDPVDWPEVCYVPMAGLPPIVVPAMRCKLGLEKAPEAYTGHLVLVFREVRRCLRDDGVLWLNLGDSYNTHAGNRGKSGQKRPQDVDGGLPAVPAGSGPTTRAMPTKNLIGIPWRVAFALQADGWYLRSDVIWAKCLSGGATVYARTQKGEMPTTIKDLVRLNPATVQLWDGEKWNQVVGWKATPRAGDEIEIELRNGARVGCTRNHRWPTDRGVIEAGDLRPGDTIQSTTLPEPKEPRHPVRLPAQDIGWFVGLYIAEGSMSDGTIQIASHADQSERFERVSAIAREYDGYAAFHRTGGNSATINVNSPVLRGIIETYVSGKTAKDKHLHPRCWHRTNGFLRSILEGYLHGDGHLREGNRWVLGFTANDALASDLRVLATRLGGSLRLRRAAHTFDGRTFPGWRGSFYFDPSQRKRSDYEVVAIRPSRARKFYDIAIESEPHLFALGCGALTHNSNPMPESVTDRPSKSHEYIFLMTKSENYFYDHEAVREKSEWVDAEGRPLDAWGRRVQGKQFGNNLPDSRDETASVPRSMGANVLDGRRNKRTVWNVPTESTPEAHFATWPKRLVEPMIHCSTSSRGACPSCGSPYLRVVHKERTPTRPGIATKITELSDSKERNAEAMGWNRALDIGNRDPQRHVTRVRTVGWKASCSCKAGKPVPCRVLDPFLGSGTTAEVCGLLDRICLGLELNPQYLSDYALVRAEAGDRPHKTGPSRRKRHASKAEAPTEPSLFGA